METKTHSSVYNKLTNLSRSWSVDINSVEFARRLDEEDSLKDFRKLFHIPKKKYLTEVRDNMKDENEECIYLTGQSLGLQLKSMQSCVQDVLNDWAEMGDQCHFRGHFPATMCDSLVKEKMASIIGAEPSEVAIMNGLTVNIHLMLGSFYHPTADRHKILMLAGGFHSDLFAVRSHIASRGYDPENSVTFVSPKPGENLVHLSDILNVIEEEGKSIALIFPEAVHFYTGQLFDIEGITRAGHEQGCVVGFDLAHAVGNVKLQLHDWNIDFGVWCTYKYLNSGAGCLGGIFCHQRQTQGTNAVMPSMTGWWGLNQKQKFAFGNEFVPAEGADRFKISNPPPVLCRMLLASLEVFEEAGIDRLQEKQLLLTGYLEYLIREHFESDDSTGSTPFQIITPSDPRRRGSQISLRPSVPTSSVTKRLKSEGIACDVRREIIRVTPIPLYNTFSEVYQFVHILKDLIQTNGYDENLNIDSHDIY